MTRREAMVWLGRAAAVGVAGCVLQDSCAMALEDGAPKPLVNLTAISMESAQEFAKNGIIVVRTSKGLAAFSNICTHRHKELSIQEKTGAIVCEAHGSQFSLEGKPLSGPASRPLKWLKLSVDEQGGLFVDPNTTVNNGMWTDPPKWAQPRSE